MLAKSQKHQQFSQTEFPRHALKYHPKCKWAKPYKHPKVWLDKEGETWWNSEEDMIYAKQNPLRVHETCDYKYINEIVTQGTTHHSLIKSRETGRTIFSCSCGHVLKATERRGAIAQIKKHVSEEHHVAGTKNYLMIPAKTKGISEMESETYKLVQDKTWTKLSPKE